MEIKGEPLYDRDTASVTLSIRMYFGNIYTKPLLDHQACFAPKRHVRPLALAEKHPERKPSADKAPRWAFQAAPGRLACWAPTVQHIFSTSGVINNFKYIMQWGWAMADLLMMSGAVRSLLLTFKATVNAAEVIQPWY